MTAYRYHDDAPARSWQLVQRGEQGGPGQVLVELGGDHCLKHRAGGSGTLILCLPPWEFIVGSLPGARWVPGEGLGGPGPSGLWTLPLFSPWATLARREECVVSKAGVPRTHLLELD